MTMLPALLIAVALVVAALVVSATMHGGAKRPCTVAAWTDNGEWSQINRDCE
jgi:hypothetical protein